jgi:cGMP-dependent protein kinase 1
VDSKGYMKLINLSTSKIIRTENNQMSKTFTIIGTPHYMAPDIILGKGYNNLVDLWSLGVCLYEFLCGVLPFGDSAEGPYDIYEEIMQSELKFPEFINDKKAKKLIEQLLSHNPEQRHGGSFANLKTHPWFEDFNWNDLLMKNDKKLEPPYVPEVSLRNVKETAANANGKFLESIRQLESKPDLD